MNPRTGDGAGGLRVDGMTPNNHFRPPMSNQNVTDNLDQRRLDFLELAKLAIAKAARSALDRNPNLTPKQKEQLRDAERGRYAHGNRLIALLLEGMAESVNPLALVDELRAATLRSVAAAVMPSLCVLDTFLENTRAQHVNDTRQVEFLFERTPQKRDAVLDTLGPEEVTLHRHKMAVLAWNPTHKRIFA